MDLYLVRHGETVDNENNTIQGHQPGKLSEHGIEQCRLTGQRLATENFADIYCSDLERAKESLQHFVKDTERADFNSLLREKSFGKHEGQSLDDYNKIVQSSGTQAWEYKPEGGESLKEVFDRAGQFLDVLLKKYVDSADPNNSIDEYKKVLVVSHRGFLNELMTLLKQKKGTAHILVPGGFDPCSITIIRINKNNVNNGSAAQTVYDFISTNEVSHLNPQFSD